MFHPDTKHLQTLVEAVKAGDERKVLAALALGVDPRVLVTIPGLGNFCLLTIAALKGHTHLLPHLLREGLSVEGPGQPHITPLMAAAMGGHKQMVAALLTAGADPHTRGYQGSTAIHQSAYKGHVECVRLLAKRTNTNTSNDLGKTPVHAASLGNHTQVLQELEAADWDLQVKDNDGRTALHFAAMSGSLEAVKHLVEVGVSLKDVNSIGETPLDVAVREGRHSVESWLRKKTSEPAGDGGGGGGGQSRLSQMVTMWKVNEIPYKYLLASIRNDDQLLLNASLTNTDIHLRDETGLTVLHWAVKEGRVWAVSYLLSQGVHPHTKTYDGLTPADLATGPGGYDLRRALSHHKCPKSLESPAELYQQLLEVIAKREDDVAAASELLCRGAPLQDESGKASHALQVAVSCDRPRIVSLLLAVGASFTPTTHGLNLLHLAWYSSDTTARVLSHITKTYFDILKFELKRAPGHVAGLREGMVQVAVALRGPTPWLASWPQGESEVGLTRLMVEASRANYLLTASLLHEAGARPFICGQSGVSPLHAALEARHWGLAEAVLRDMEGCLYVADATGRLPTTIMPHKLRWRLEQNMYRNEKRKLENLHESVKSESEKQQVRDVMDLQHRLFTRYRQNKSGGKMKSGGGHHALLVAARTDLLQLTHLLLKVAGLDVNTVVDHTCGTTALHQAASHGKSGCVALLLSAGADPLHPDHYTQTPIHMAAMFGHATTYQLLKQHVTHDPACRAGTTPQQTLNNYNNYLKLYRKCGDSARETLKPYKDHDAKQVINKILNAIDLKDLLREAERVRVDFSVGEAKVVREVVMQELSIVMQEVANIDSTYEGSLSLVGSSMDGNKLYAPDEYDVNVVLHSVTGVTMTVVEQDEATAKHSCHKYKVEVVTDNPRLQGNNLMNNLYGAMENCLSSYVLKDERLSLVPPGLTRTQVGVALSLAWQGSQYPLLLVGVDIVPVLTVAWYEKINRPALTPPATSNIHLSNGENGSWRCSFAKTEAEVLQGLDPQERRVLLVAKTLLSCMRPEPWMPRELKAYCTWWSGRAWKVPVPAGFCLKNSFLRQLEHKRNTGDTWEERDTVKHVASIFRRMCQVFDSYGVAQSKLIAARSQAYFGGDCESSKGGHGAPQIFSHLRQKEI